MARHATIYLVGTGPGDPDLLTVKALRLLQNADVVVYDRLVSDAILALIPSGTSRIYVGKKTGKHTMPQPEINELLVRLADASRAVVRLKGGDPFVFGRGSEEAEHLARHNIRFEIVPGITSAPTSATSRSRWKSA
ncbi:MAG TPA: uroporphyrinogen-III C-methyltransferase [Chromatiales bacterium]|nr:uroporphyrinogen-III C-methyltransferase [Chromatiales bacterium]